MAARRLPPPAASAYMWGRLKSPRETTVTTFEERQRGQEAKYQHDQELGFKVRNRRNKLFGLWLAGEHLGLDGDRASAYAKDVVMADFESPGDADMLGKVRADLTAAGKDVTDQALERRLKELDAEARRQVMAE